MLGAGEPWRAGQVRAGARAREQGVCGVLVAAPGRTTGPGMLGEEACHGARGGGRRLMFLGGFFQNQVLGFGESSSVIRVTRSTSQRRAMV